MPLLTSSSLADFTSPQVCWAQRSDIPPELQMQFTSLEAQAINQVKDLIAAHSHLFAFEKLGSTDLIQHSITLNDPRPVKQAPRKLSVPKILEAQKEVESMLQAGIVRPSSSPWTSPVVTVPKKDGSRRFCVDYRVLNSHTKVDAYPLPEPQTILDSLKGCSWFATLDMKSGFW